MRWAFWRGVLRVAVGLLRRRRRGRCPAGRQQLLLQPLNLRAKHVPATEPEGEEADGDIDDGGWCWMQPALVGELGG